MLHCRLRMCSRKAGHGTYGMGTIGGVVRGLGFRKSVGITTVLQAEAWEWTFPCGGAECRWTVVMLSKLCLTLLWAPILRVKKPGMRMGGQSP
ncbi:hypothetical protein V6N13_079711 [Hibiscus sabdariffa]